MAAGVHGSRRSGLLHAALRTGAMGRCGGSAARDRTGGCAARVALADRTPRRGRSGLCLGPDRDRSRAADRGRPANPRQPSLPARSERWRRCRRGVGSPFSPPGSMVRQSLCAARCASGCRRRTTATWAAATPSASARWSGRRRCPPIRAPGTCSVMHSTPAWAHPGTRWARRSEPPRRYRPVRCGSCNGCAKRIARRVVAVIPGAAGAVSVTLLTGASMAIPEADHAAFRDSGLAHLLAVAGLHIGIVMGFALAIVPLRLCAERACQPVLANQEAGGALRAGGRGRLHGADRHACADHPQLRHGLPVHGRDPGGPAAVFAARSGAGGHGADADRAAGSAERLVPDELLGGARADRRIRGAASLASAPAWRQAGTGGSPRISSLWR